MLVKVLINYRQPFWPEQATIWFVIDNVYLSYQLVLKLSLVKT